MWGLMRELYPENTLNLAEEPGYGRYLCRHYPRNSHADVTMYSARDYVISRVASQISEFFCQPCRGWGREDDPA